MIVIKDRRTAQASPRVFILSCREGNRNKLPSARVPLEMAEYLPQASVCEGEMDGGRHGEGARLLKLTNKPRDDVQNWSHR